MLLIISHVDLYIWCADFLQNFAMKMDSGQRPSVCAQVEETSNDGTQPTFSYCYINGELNMSWCEISNLA